MIIKGKISNNRVLSSREEICVSDSPIIRRYLWKLGVGSKSLQLLVDQGDGLSYTIPLDGTLFLEFGLKRCSYCDEIIPRATRDAICDLCRDSLIYKCQRCIFEGPGKPFDVKCTLESYPCQLAWKHARCYSDHYLYLGRFGNKIKVGISNCRRSEGKYYRLIEQGLDEALVLSKFSSLENVLAAEAMIADQLHLTTFLTFADKIQLLTNYEKTSEIVSLYDYAEQLLELYPDCKITNIDLLDTWGQIGTNRKIKTVSFPNTLAGEVVYSRGNIVLVQPVEQQTSEEVVYAYNLSHLKGLEVLTTD